MPQSRAPQPKEGVSEEGYEGRKFARSAGREAAKSDDGGLLGIALIAIGVLLILGVWFSLAGPAGDGAGTFLGWFLGIGRHVLPIVLIGSGVAVLRDHEPQEPIRLGVGWVLAVLSSLGFIHVIRTPTSLTDLMRSVRLEVSSAWLVVSRCNVCRTRRSGGGSHRSVHRLHRVDHRSIAAEDGGADRDGGRDRSRPVAKFLRQSMSNLATLQSERAEERRRSQEEADDDIGEPQATLDPLAVSPTLYDGADDDEFAEPTPKAPRKKRVPKAAPAQSETAPVPAAPVKPGEWHLPSMAMLEKAGEQSVDMKSVEARGATLQESLSQHGSIPNLWVSRWAQRLLVTNSNLAPASKWRK